MKVIAMNKYKKHIFICENIRDEDNPAPSCGRRGGIEIREKIKKRLRELGETKNFRANSAGCLGACKFGPVAVIYPQETWYGNLSSENIDKIIQSDLMNDEVVNELEINDVK